MEVILFITHVFLLLCIGFSCFKLGVARTKLQHIRFFSSLLEETSEFSECVNAENIKGRIYILERAQEIFKP